MALGEGRDSVLTKPYLPPHGFITKPVPVTMTSVQNSRHLHTYSDDEDVKKLTDLMERYHSMNGLSERKQKGVLKENTFQEGVASSKIQKLQSKMKENLSKNSEGIEKPIPPITQLKRKKSDPKKTSSKAGARDKKKFNESFKAKLYTGKGIGVSVFRLKDSLAEDNVLHSIPQEDVKYSFHQPPPPPSKMRNGLYHDALASSHKYNVANGVPKGRKTYLTRQHTFHSDIQKPVTGIARDIKFHLNKAMEPLNALRNRSQLRDGIEKSNTFIDFRFGRRQGENKLPPGSQVHKSHGEKQNQLPTGDAANIPIGMMENVSATKKDPTKHTSHHQEKHPSGFSSLPVETSHSQSKRPLPTASFVDMSPEPLTIEVQGSDVKDRYSAEHATGFANIAETQRVIRMPKFVRRSDELFAKDTASSKSAARNANAQPPMMSASSYYISTYPRHNTPSSVGSAKKAASRPSSSQNAHSEKVRDMYLKTRSLSRGQHASPPPPTPASRVPSPSTVSRLSPLQKKSYLNLSKVMPKSQTMKEKERTADVRIPRKLQGMKQGRISGEKKPKEEKLETVIQGYACVASSQPGDNKDDTNMELQTEHSGDLAGQDSVNDLKIMDKGQETNQNFLEGERTDKDSIDEKRIKSSKAVKDDSSNAQHSHQAPKIQGFEAFDGLVIKSRTVVDANGESVSTNSKSVQTMPMSNPKMRGRLAPLMKLKKSRFILARTSGGTEESDPVQLVSDPIIFSVRHPALAGDSARSKDDMLPTVSEDEVADKGDTKEHLPDLPDDVAARALVKKGSSRLNGFHHSLTDDEQTLLVFFHTSQSGPGKQLRSSLPRTKYGIVYKNTLKTMKEDAQPHTLPDHVEMSSLTKNDVSGMYDTNDEMPYYQNPGKPDLNLKIPEESAIIADEVLARNRKRRKFISNIASRNGSRMQNVGIKTTAGGGFKSNVAHYSMLYRQHQQLKQDQKMFLHMMQQQFLHKHDPDCNSKQASSMKFPSIVNPLHKSGEFEKDRTELSSMIKKFPGGHHHRNHEDTKERTYTMFSSRHPAQGDEPHHKEDTSHHHDDILSKTRRLNVKLNYIWPEPKRRSSFPAASKTQKPVNKSNSLNSDLSSTHSLSVKDLNFELKPDGESSKAELTPVLGRASIPGKYHEHFVAPEDFHPRRLDSRFAVLPIPEIFEKLVSPHLQQERVVICNEDNDLEYSLEEGIDSAAILPDHTTSYRLTHDVSFDEGSRYKTTGDFPHGLKGREDVRGHHSPAEGSNARVNGTLGPPRHDGRISVGRDHSASNNISFKETVPLSLIRMEDRFAADLPPTTSPSSPALSTLNAAPNSSSTFIPPPSASRQQHPSQGSGGTITTFRLHKEKQNWNYRLGDLSINGGGYYSATVSSRQDIQNHMNSLTVSSVSSNQRNSQTRERTVLAPKSRMSSRYSSKAESGNASASFSDPCIAAPPSFQQRLTDLSLLESETIKYERNRKVRRKKNQDKDS